MARNSPVSGVSGAVRIHRLSGVSLAAAEAHGKRLDHAGKARRVRDAEALTNTGLDLRDLHQRHISDAHMRKGPTVALHMVLQFPTDLVDAEDKEKQKDMLKHARSFAEGIFGDAAIFGDRVDQDEKSRHVVDLFLAPKYTKTTKRGSKLAVSTSIHLKKLAEERGKPPTLKGQGQALQDAWFEYLRDKMNLNVKRGSEKVRPGDDWQTPEQLELERQREELEAEVEAVRQRAEKNEARAAAAHANAETYEKRAKDAEREIEPLEGRIAALKGELKTVTDAVAQKKTKIARLESTNSSLRQRKASLLARLQILSAA